MKIPDDITRKLVKRTLSNLDKKVGNRLPPLAKPGDQSSDSVRINCRDCQFFYVTWQVSTPYGCKAHGFKSAQLPSLVVFASSGEHCLLFRRKV